MRTPIAAVRMIAMLALSFHISSSVVYAGPLEDGQAAYSRGDYATALRLFRPLAEQGDASAQNALGWMYREGSGVNQDFKEAMKWYRLAAEHGSAQAQYNLGVMYYQGSGVAKDLHEAMKWYRAAATQGEAQAQYNLGFMYAKGEGVPKDVLRAHMWWNIAAEQGNAGAWGSLNAISLRMTKEQIAKAQALAQKCKASNYEQCD